MKIPCDTQPARSLRMGLLLFGLLLSTGAPAQLIFINDATVHRVSGPVLQKGDVLIRDGRIESIGARLRAPADATVIEAGGKPLTPAFWAGTSALGLEEIGAEISSVDQALQWDATVHGNPLRPEFDVSPAFNPHSTAVPVTRIEGFGWTLLSAEELGSFIGGQGRAVSLDGGYESFVSDPVLFISIGARSSALAGQSRAAQFMLLNQAIEEARGNAVAAEPLLTAPGQRALAGFLGQGRVVFTVDRASDIRQVLRFARENEITPIIASGAEAWMVADELAEAGVPVMLNPLVNLPGNFDQLGARLDNAAVLHARGVTVAFASGRDASHNARKLRQAAGVAVAYGLPYEVGIRGLTLNPARMFDLPPGHGSLEEDGPADLVLWSGDPLEVTTLAETVVLGGRLVPMESRQTLLRDRYLPQNPELPRAYIKPQE